MFKSKKVLLGIVAGAAVVALIAAGFTMNVASGAGTDVGHAPQGDLTIPSNPAPSDNPPASPIEPPSVPTNPADDSGSQLGVDGAPGSLPNAGYGAKEGNRFAALVALLAVSGIAIATVGGAGAAFRPRR